MLSLPVPFTSARLDLELPFGFLPTLVRIVLVALLLGGILAVSVWPYRVELRRVGGRTARLLLVLRLAVIVAVVGVLVAGPVLVRRQPEPVAGHVLVAVDLSDSMRVNDPDRPLGEKLRLARGLRLHYAVTSDELLDGWIGDVDRSGVPQFPPPDTDAGVARRAMLDEVRDRATALTRLQAVERALGPAGVALLDRLRESHTVEVVGFTQTLIDLPPEPRPLPPHPPGPAYTDLKLPLTRAIESRGEGGQLGVVVFTDGRHTWGEPPAALAQVLAAKGVPVFPVNVAPRDPPEDVAVVAVNPAVSTVCRGSSVPVDVQVRATRWHAGRIEVTLRPDDGRPPLTQTIRHDGNDQVHRVTFHPRFDKAGTQAITAEAKPQVPDTRQENNTRSVRISVVDYKPRVLLIDGEARWEFRYLHSALLRSRDPELDVKSVVLRQPRIGTTPDAVAETTGLPLLTLPEGEDALAGFDCVLLGDVTAEQFPLRQRERLEKYVSDAGGTLVIVAGKRGTPVGLMEGVSDGDPLQKLLPIRNPRALTPVPQGLLPAAGLVPEFTPEGRRAWFLRLADAPEQDRVAWEGLPPHEWAAVGEPKEGAEALATIAIPRVGLPRVGEPPEKPGAVIARHHYGFGRVLYVGLESTWRWRFKVGDEHHHRFWKQAVQWAAADRLLPAQNAAGTVRFGPRQQVYHSGEEVELLLRATEAVPKLPPTAVKAVRVVRLADATGKGESPVGLLSLENPEGRPRELTTRLRGLPPGRYAVEPEVPEWSDHLRGSPGEAGRTGKLRATFEVQSPESDEVTELAANLPLLESLAAVTGGQVFDIAGVGGLGDRLTARTAEKESETITPLRRSWWTLALIALLLATEWVVRKLSGLA